MTTQSGYIMTLANSIIGVSLLAMPYCFKQCGLLLGITLLLACNIVTRVACHLLVKCGVMCRRKNYQHIGYHAFGLPGKVVVELGVIGFLMGTSVAYFVVIGDLAPIIISKLMHVENNESLRTNVLLATGVLIILPLSLVRNIESLAAISTGTIVFYLLLVCKVLTESFAHLAAADWLGQVNLWRPQAMLQCFPIFAMALSCQTQVFEIMQVLPNPTLERMNGVVRSAVNLCTGLYVGVGFLGYVAYSGGGASTLGANTLGANSQGAPVASTLGGNVLLSFSSSMSSDLFLLGFVFSVALSFPIVVFPCRASLNSFLFNKGAQYSELTTASSYIPDARFKLLTVGIVSTGLTTGLLVPNIEFVLGFVGSTIGVVICIIFPSAAFVSISGKDTTERLVAKCVVVLGLMVMILGMYGNMSVATDDVHVPGDVSPLLHSPVPPPVPIPEQLPPTIKDEKPKVEKIVPPIIEPKLPEKRLEPPIPMEPAQTLPKPEPQKVANPKPDVPDLVKSPILPEDPKTKTEIQKKDIKPAVDTIIHNDAIAREEHQIKENDQLEKKEENRQGEELLIKLKEHKEEQKQLLQEQQNILEEIKIRGGEPVSSKPVLPIESEKFNENIDKIQEVIDDLKERKQVLDRTKGEKIAEEKKKNAEKKNITKIEPLVNLPVILKAIAPVVINGSVNHTVEEEHRAPGARDILAANTAPEALTREKRDAEDESCPKHDKVSKLHDTDNVNLSELTLHDHEHENKMEEIQST